MRPEIFRIPFLDLPIHGYGLMIVIGFLLASWLATREARRRGLPEIIYDLGVVMLLSGLVGGRIFYYIQFYDENFAREPWYRIFAIWEGGLVFFGGALGGALGGYLFLRAKRLDIAAFLDTVAPFVPIGMGFGRLGCFMNGCCYGARCDADFALGIRFPQGSHGAYDLHLREALIPAGAEWSLPVYPVQLLEAGQDFILCALLVWLTRGPLPRGGAIPLLFALYGIERFFMEFLRGDHGPDAATFTTLTFYQNVAIVIFVGFSALFAVCWARSVRTGWPEDDRYEPRVDSFSARR